MMNLDVVEVLAILAAGFTAGSIFTIGIYKIATHEKDKEEEPISVVYKALRDDIHDYNDCILNRLKSIENTIGVIENCTGDTLAIVDTIKDDMDKVTNSKKDKMVKYTNAIKESFGQFTKEFLNRIENTVKDGKDEEDE